MIKLTHHKVVDTAVVAALAVALGACAMQSPAPASSTSDSPRLAPTSVHLPPGTHADLQEVRSGQAAPHHLGLMLTDTAGKPLDRVGIAARDLTRFPRYTGGLLVQDVNTDGVLDPAADKVVGGIIGAAPEGAKGQSAASPVGPDGKPVLSGAGPNPGVLLVQFRAGDKPGAYRPTFELIGGNSHQFTLNAVTQP